MSKSKPKVVKDYDKLSPAIREQLKLKYPSGFHKHLISFKNKKNKFVSALPFDTHDKSYLIRMTQTEAQDIIQADEDYNINGKLKSDVKTDYESKYSDLENMVANMDEDF